MARRDGRLYESVEELWQCAGVPAAALERLAEADAFHSLGLNRRNALWAVRGLADAPLPLFAASRQNGVPAPETPEGVEPGVALVPMPAAQEVVEDYRSTGLTLRQHPIAFVRDELRRDGTVRCADLVEMRSGQRVLVSGLVLVRQKPGSAKGVMFMTVEDETGVANLIIWPSLFRKQRRLILSASMLACRGFVQKANSVVHVIAERLTDRSDLLRSVGEREGFPLSHGRGDEARTGGGTDRRGPGRVRDITVPDLRPSSGIEVPARNFR